MNERIGSDFICLSGDYIESPGVLFRAFVDTLGPHQAMCTDIDSSVNLNNKKRR